MRMFYRQELLSQLPGEGLRHLRRPGRNYVPPRLRDTIRVMAKRSYKVYADLWLNLSYLSTKLAVLGPEVGSNFIGSEDLPPRLREVPGYIPGHPEHQRCNSEPNCIGRGCPPVDTVKHPAC